MMVTEALIRWSLGLVKAFFNWLPDWAGWSGFDQAVGAGAHSIGRTLYTLSDWLPADVIAAAIQQLIGLVVVLTVTMTIIWVWGKLPFVGR